MSIDIRYSGSNGYKQLYVPLHSVRKWNENNYLSYQKIEEFWVQSIKVMFAKVLIDCSVASIKNKNIFYNRR